MGFACLASVCLIFATFLANHGAVANPEVSALISFKQSLEDPTNALKSWDSDLVNPCTWIFVTCDDSDSVVRLDLGNKMLSGPLSPYLTALKNLQYLELYKNQFNGSIPFSWGSMKNLISLDLYQNNIVGEIPAALGQLPKLVFLRLNNNQLEGNIPKELGKIDSLNVLDLSYNNLKGEVPSEGSLNRFSSVSFKGNQVCGRLVGEPCQTNE